MGVPKNRGKCKSATISLHRGDSLSMSSVVWALSRGAGSAQCRSHPGVTIFQMSPKHFRPPWPCLSQPILPSCEILDLLSNVAPTLCPYGSWSRPGGPGPLHIVASLDKVRALLCLWQTTGRVEGNWGKKKKKKKKKSYPQK